MHSKKKSKNQKIKKQRVLNNKERTSTFRSSLPVEVIFLLFLMLLTMAVLKSAYGVSIKQTLLFYTGAFVFLYCPGRFVLRLSNWSDNRASLIILSVLTGMALSPIIYFLARIIKMDWVYLVTVLPMGVFAIYQGGVEFLKRRRESTIQISAHLIMAGVAFLLILLLLHSSHFTDVSLLPDGGFLLRYSGITETIFHLGIINALRDTVLPPYPYASGYTLPYHMDMHLLADLLCRYTGISTLMMTYFFLPLLFFGLIVAVPAIFFYRLHPHFGLSLFFGLMMFGADLSFIPGIFKSYPEAYPWTLIFKSTIWGIFTLNGIIPTIPLMFGFLLVFQSFFKENNSRYLILIILFAVAAFREKSSMGAQILGCALPAAIFAGWKLGYKSWWKMIVALGLAGLIVVSDFILKPKPTEHITRLLWQPFNGLTWTLKQLGYQHPLELGIITLMLLFLVYCVGFLGVRVIFFREVFELLRGKIKFEPVIPLLLFFVLGGIILSEFIYIGGNDQINNGQWFAVQSLYAASYFPVAFIERISGYGKKVAMIGVIIFCMIPTTWNFLHLRKDNQYVTITKEQMQVAEVLKTQMEPGAIILDTPVAGGISLAAHFAGKVTVLTVFRTFLTSAVGTDALKERINDINSFFNPSYKGDRKKILHKYHVHYVLALTTYKDVFKGFSFLTPLFESKNYIIYQTQLVKNPY